jgi:penicillin-binding protein 1C
LYDLLKESGVRSLTRPPEHYGLSLVLGGGEITLLELADLYASLARHGRKIEIAMLADSARGDVETRLFSAEAAAMVLDILTDVPRPELGAVWRSGRRTLPVPWKTGTSFGRRDAWSVGVAGKYVVAVWLGNFDGAGVPSLVGVEVAAPLLFEVVEVLPHDEAGSWHREARDLEPRLICATSGRPPGPHCSHTQWGSHIPGVSPATPCDVHREILVDTRSGCAVCSRCQEEGTTSRRIVEWWPSPVARHLRVGRLMGSEIPPHNPRCRALEPGKPPQITSPQKEAVYYVRPQVPVEDQRIALTAAVSAGTYEVFWFVDGKLVWKGPPDRPVFVEPEEGVHDLCLKDDRGRSARQVLRVKKL